MAQAKQTNNMLSAIAGAAFAVGAMLAPGAATAQDVTPVSQTHDTVWTDELRALREASDKAQDYAEQNYGVGVLIHVGEDFPNAHFQTPDQFAKAMVGLFEAKYNTPARAFLRPNPGTSNTGLTFHIGNQIHGANSGKEVKSVGQAIAAMPDVVEQLRIVKEIAALQPNQPAPFIGG